MLANDFEDVAVEVDDFDESVLFEKLRRSAQLVVERVHPLPARAFPRFRASSSTFFSLRAATMARHSRISA